MISFNHRKPVNAGPGAMKLGGKSRDVDSFVDQLKEEGENVVSGPLAAPGTKSAPTPQIMNTELYVISLIHMQIITKYIFIQINIDLNKHVSLQGFT